MQQLGWKPAYDLDSLVQEMVTCDIESFRKEQLLKESGFNIKNQFE
jgi:GDPmannose 4,6-dehydratase